MWLWCVFKNGYQEKKEHVFQRDWTLGSDMVSILCLVVGIIEEPI